jgi:cytochrome c553
MPAGTAPLQRTPGGDFGWLKKTYSAVTRGNTIIENDTHGHNIIAADKGYVADSRNSVSPGGSYPNAQFHCNSCHDPHGKYRRATGDTVSTTGLPIKTSGSYNNNTLNEPDALAAVGAFRILAGSGYEPVSSIPGAGFPGVPPAKVKSGYNASEATTQTRVAYGVVSAAGNTTWGNWCGSCHGAMHSSGNYVHPVDMAMSSTVRDNYNQYVKSGNMTGTTASSFSSLAPFATDASATYATLNGVSANTPNQGPGAGDQVNCMSCHRAHASGFQYMMRFDYEQPMFVSNGVYPTYLSRTPAETQAAYYDRPASTFAAYQRVWCNKCHAKD